MKTKRLLALIAALLCLSMLFVSCKKKNEEPEEETSDTTAAPTETAPEGLAKIFNLDWTRPAPESTVATKKTDLTLNMSNRSSVNNLIHYTDPTNSNIQCVYDYVAEKDILTLTDSVTSAEMPVEGTTRTVYTHVNNYVYMPSGKNVVVLTVTYLSLNEYSNDTLYLNYFWDHVHSYLNDSYDELTTTYKITVYNAADTTTPVKTIGSDTIKSWIYLQEESGETISFSTLFYNNVVKDLALSLDSLEYDSYRELADDLILHDNKIYRVDSDENLTLVREVGMTNVSAGQTYSMSENYYYHGRTIYDKSLNPIDTWSVPSYCRFFNDYVLNNGDLLVQYTVLLDETAEDYDYLEVTSSYGGLANYKYDLHTFIVSAKDGKMTEIDADYKIQEWDTAYSTNPDYNDYYAEGIENLAMVSYIEDGRLDTSAAKYDLVSLDNEGEIVESLKLYDEWTTIPGNDGTGYFSAQTVHSTIMVMDKDGKILTDKMSFDTTGYLTGTRNYFLFQDGIYDMVGTKVYDLTDKIFEYSELDFERDTLLITVLADDGVMKVDLFNKGTVTTIGTMDATGVNTDGENVTLREVNTTSFGYYTKAVTKDAGGTETTTYNWYNVEGTLLATTNYALTRVASYDDVYLYTGQMQTADGYTTVYHKFS